ALHSSHAPSASPPKSTVRIEARRITALAQPSARRGGPGRVLFSFSRASWERQAPAWLRLFLLLSDLPLLCAPLRPLCLLGRFVLLFQGRRSKPTTEAQRTQRSTEEEKMEEDRSQAGAWRQEETLHGARNGPYRSGLVPSTSRMLLRIGRGRGVCTLLAL